MTRTLAYRAVESWGTSPLRLAALSLLLLVILAGNPDASAHGFGSNPTGFASDNIIRFDMVNEPRIEAEEDKGLTCPRWTGNPGGFTGTESDGFCVNPNLGYTGALNLRLLNLWSFNDASSQATTGRVETLARITAAENTSAPGGNQSILNITFSRGYNVTNLDWQFLANGNGMGSGNAALWARYLDTANATVRETNIITYACNAGPDSLKSVANTFANITVKRFEVWMNTSLCSFGTDLRIDMLSMSLWSQNDKDRAIAQTSNVLEFADWALTRDGTQDGNSNAGTSNISGSNLTVVPTGVSYFFGVGSCNIEGTACGTSEQGFVWPQSYTIGNSLSCSPSTDFMGISATSKKPLAVFRIDNQCGGNVEMRLDGFLISNDRVHYFNTDRIYKASTTGGDLAGDGSTKPTVFFCTCPQGNAFDQAALLYRENDLLATVPQGVVWSGGDSGLPINNLLTATTGIRSQPNATFTVTIDPEQYWGNALYFAVVAYNTSIAPDLCSSEESTLTVSGVSGLPLLGRLSGQNGTNLLTLCVWLIDDTTRSRAIPVDASGNNQFLENSRAARTITVKIADFPTEAKGANGGLGYELEAIQAFDGRKWLHAACTQSPGPLCYANADTGSWPLAGDPINITWNWQVNDKDAGVALNASRVFDSGTVTSGLTNTSGQVQLFTTGTRTFAWTVTKDGYGTGYFNYTNLNVNRVNVTVNMTRDPTKPFILFRCSVDASLTLVCYGDPSATSDVCITTGGTLTCQSQASGMRFVFTCPQDTSNSVLKIINGVNVTDSLSGLAFTTNSFTLGSGCANLEVTSIPSPEGRFTWSKDGFRSVSHNLSGFEGKRHVRYSVLMKTGDGAAGAVSVSITNTTINQDGFAVDAAFITLTDTGGPSTVASQAGGVAPVEVSFVNVCGGFGFGSGQGLVICGFILWAMITAVVVGMWIKVTNAEGIDSSAVAGASVVSFGVVGVLGVWPTWFIVLVVVGVAAAAVYASRRD